jgi:formylglycine-generating enzyme required for sulfatase activity/Flp pilus assembly protein TadD
MRRKLTLGFVTLIFSLACGLALAKPPQNMPLSKDQVMGLVRNHLGDETGAKVVEQRKIDFAPTDDFINELRMAGAAEVFLKAVRDAAPTSASAPTAGTVGKNAKDGLNYVWIPPGSFIMGCSPGDTECLPDEKPAHQVAITKGFWIGQTEVTVGAYKRFAAATGYGLPPAPKFNDGWTNENMPIMSMSWNDAKAFCQWVGGRLPTEAEWEYAARAGSTEARYGPPGDVAWYGDAPSGAHEVAQKRANGFSLYDMLGNATEWVADWYEARYYQVSPSQDPTGPVSGSAHVLRGGSWGDLVPPRVSKRDQPFLLKHFVLEAGSWTAYGFRCATQAEILLPPQNKPSNTDQVTSGRLDIFQISRLLINGVASQHIADLVKERGIAFAPVEIELQLLKDVGASPDLLDSMQTPAATVAWVLSKSSPESQEAERKHAGEVEQDYRDRLRRDPSNVSTRVLLAYALGVEGKGSDSTQVMRDGIRLRPDSAVLHFWLAMGLMNPTGPVNPSAIEEFRAAVRLDPKYAPPHVGLAIALARNGDQEGALAEYRAAIAAEPDSGMARSDLASVLEHQGDISGAAEQYREMLKRNPQNEFWHISLAVLLARHNDLDGAIAEYHEALRIAPGDPLAHKALGMALLTKGDLDGAMAEYREASRLAPSDAVPHANLGILLGRKGDTDGAIRELREATRLDPKLGAAHLFLGEVLWTKGEKDAALDELRQAVELDAKNVDGHVFLSAALLAHGDIDGALDQGRQAEQLNPNDPRGHARVADALLKRGDLGGALAEVRETIRLAPKDAGAHYYAGLILQKQGKPSDALLEYRAATDLAPNNATYRQAYDQLAATLSRTR